MTLPASGPISTAEIRAEIGGGGAVTFPSAETRTLTGIPAGAIVLPNSFHGKSSGGGGGGGSGCALTNTRSANTSGGVASLTSVSFGVAAADRRVFMLVEWACTTSAVETLISSFTMTGGTDARIHAQTGEGGTSASTNFGVAIISARVAAGTSGTVAITFNNATVRTVRGTAYRVVGIVAATATDTASVFDEHVFAPSSVSAQGTCTVPSSGLLFVAGMVSSDGSLDALTFTGATERVDAAGGVQDRYGSAMSFGLASQSNRPVGVAGGASTTSRARVVAASFQLS